MKTLFAILVMLTSVAAGNSVDQQPNSEVAAILPQLPPLMDLGIIVVPDSKAVVGGCECHSPFAKANFMGGDRIVSVDGKKVDSIKSLRRALSLTRTKRSIEFVIVPKFRWDNQHLKKLVVKFPPNWWKYSR